MCEAGDREQQACVELLKEIKGNGRCEYHEDLVKGLWWVKGGVAVILLLLGVTVGTTIHTSGLVSANTQNVRSIDIATEKIQLQIETHMAETAHPVMHQRADEMERRLDQLERKFDNAIDE